MSPRNTTRRPRPLRRRPLLTFFDPLEPRQFLSVTPATHTSLTLSSPVLAANQPLSLTATVTSDDPATTPTGTVAFFETVDLSRDLLHHYDIPDLVSLPNSSTTARLLGTATLNPDGTATLSLPSIPSSSAIYTGQFQAAFLGSTPTFSLASATTPAPTYAAPDQTLGPNPTPSTTDSVTYLLFPQNHPLSLHNAQLTVLSDLPTPPPGTIVIPPNLSGLTTPNATPLDPSVPHTFSDQYGTQSNPLATPDLPDDYPTLPYLLNPSTDPLLVTINVSHVTQLTSGPFLLPLGNPTPYPNLYNYIATVTPAPAFAHAFDANPSFQSSLSPVGTPATDEPTSLSLRASSPTATLTAPPTFTVSVFNLDGTQRLSRTAPSSPSNGASYHSAQAGLIVSTGGGGIGSGGVIITGGGGTVTPPRPFVAPGPFPTGSVSFFDENNTLLATVPLDADGNASFVPDPRTFPLGSHTLHASYSGDPTFLPAQVTSDPFTITHTTTTTDLVTSSPGVHANETFALAATVSAYDTITPTGTITFSEGETVLASVPLGQTSSIHLNLPAGTHTITASYAGDADCLPSSDSTTVTILDATSTANPPPVTVPPDYTIDNPGAIYDVSDAALTSVRYDPTPFARLVPGGSLTIDVSATFTGAGPLSYPNPLFAFALSADGSTNYIPLSASSTRLFAGPLSFGPSGHVTYSNSYTATLPADLPPGSYYIVATIDPAHAFLEADRTNNTLASNGTLTVSDPASLPPPIIDPPIQIGGPISLPSFPSIFDLTLTSVTASSPFAQPGSSLTVTATPQLAITIGFNDRPITFDIAYVLSADDTLGNADDVPLGTDTANFDDTANPGPFSHTFALPASTPAGSYHLFATLDPDHSTGEANPDNDTLMADTPVTVVAPTVTGSLKPASPAAPLAVNAPVKLSLALTNTTNQPLRYKYNVTYYISSDPTLSPDDTPVTHQTLTANLAKKQSKSFHLNPKLPTNTPLGTQYLIAVADTPNSDPAAHVELASAKPLKITGPHLTTSVLTTKSLKNNRTAVTLRLTNTGSAPFTGHPTLKIFSSPTATTPLLTTHPHLSLRPNHHTDLTLTFPLPPNTLLDPSALTITLI